MKENKVSQNHKNFHNPVLVTGSTGNVGRAVVETLMKNNQAFFAAVPPFPGEKEKLPEQVPIRTLEFGNENTYKSALQDIKTIFLMRPPPITNIKHKMKPFLKIAKMMGVEYIVVLSLMGVNPFVPHFKMEWYVKRLKFSYTFLRPSFFMQNLSTTHAEAIKDTHDILIPTGNAKISFIDAWDIGEVAAKRLMQWEGREERKIDKRFKEKLVLTGPKALDNFEVSKIMTEELGEKFTYSNPSSSKFKEVMGDYGFEKKYVKIMSILYKVTKLGTAKRVNRTTERILGRKPTTLREFIQRNKNVWA